MSYLQTSKVPGPNGACVCELVFLRCAGLSRAACQSCTWSEVRITIRSLVRMIDPHYKSDRQAFSFSTELFKFYTVHRHAYTSYKGQFDTLDIHSTMFCAS